MTTIPIDEAQTKLAELIAKISPGDKVVITKNSQPVAQLTPLAAPMGQSVPGRCKGMLTVISEDNEHLEDWAEYMP